MACLEDRPPRRQCQVVPGPEIVGESRVSGNDGSGRSGAKAFRPPSSCWMSWNLNQWLASGPAWVWLCPGGTAGCPGGSVPVEPPWPPIPWPPAGALETTFHSRPSSFN